MAEVGAAKSDKNVASDGITTPYQSNQKVKRQGRFRYAGYVSRRLLQAVPIVLVVILINFILIQSAPGDPVYALIGQIETTPDFIEQVRQEYGLDQSLGQQFITYLGKVATFDFGYSFRFRQDVSDLILARVPATLLLMSTALLISSVLGIVLGVIAARHPYGNIDNTVTILAIGGYSMPVFWLSQIILLIFALHLPWFPVQGMVSLRAPSEGLGRALNILHHLVLPALVYGIYHLTLIFRLTRVKMMEVLSLDYVTIARAKGASEYSVVVKHALPNAMLPVITVIGYNFGFMLAGSVLVETVFGWPGLGRLMFEAISARDYPLLLGLFAVISLFVILANVITDILYAVIDPRILYR